MRIARLIALACGTALTGCSLAPHYAPPQVAPPAAYKESGPWQSAAATPLPAGRWWEAFGDQTLNALETRIETDNPNLAAAAARYQEATGLLRQSGAALLPEVDVSAAGERARVSANRPLSAGNAVRYNVVTLGPSLSYEIDLFGRVRNSIASASADAQASAADVAAIRLGLQASLASAYFNLRGLDARTALLNQTVAAYQRAFDLTDTRHSGGIASGIDVSRSQSQLSSARAELSAVAADRAKAEHAIAVLIGANPSSFGLAASDGLVQPPAIPAGVPSTLLERRPDIAAAERRVAAANARIGVARAALYPDITLGAGAGFQSTTSSILSAASGFWALGPLSAAMAVFDGGKRRAGVHIARAEYDEIAANYRSTVLTAFREVEDDLALSRYLAQQERDQQDAATAAERTRDLALTRYRDGASDYLDVVTAQTAALDAERALLDLRTRRMLTAADIVRAIGGSAEERPTANP
ncbi:efflux transporter outer membrane subunit [Sphingomonas sp. MMS24-J13]|uniref:efflux transporter outer membrane subunit n=1 Tax=Sphingomonas sp. MMS24-J13 TaxID=3238686 RepID=UPI00384F9CAC